jgi:hypothetical protein
MGKSELLVVQGKAFTDNNRCGKAATTGTRDTTIFLLFGCVCGCVSVCGCALVSYRTSCCVIMILCSCYCCKENLCNNKIENRSSFLFLRARCPLYYDRYLYESYTLVSKRGGEMNRFPIIFQTNKQTKTKPNYRAFLDKQYQ